MTRTATPAGLLPLSGSALASDPSVLAAAFALGTRHGVDYTDDTAVTALLTERRGALDAAHRGPLVWLGALTLMAAVTLPLFSPVMPEQAAKRALLVTGPLMVIAVAALVQVRARWKRELLHPALSGYRELLAVARAHGLAPAYVPGWLEGRRPDGSGRGVAPIPSYDRIQLYEGVRGARGIPAHGEQGLPGEAAPPRPPEPPAPVTPPPVTPKPPAVTAYETTTYEGSRHAEAGCLLVLAGGAGALWAATSDAPLGYGALALIPVAVLVWLAGIRQNDERERLRQEALAYVRVLAEAQTAGAPVPELSPVLRNLLDEQPLD